MLGYRGLRLNWPSKNNGRGICSFKIIKPKADTNVNYEIASCFRLNQHLNEHCTTKRMEDLLMNIFLKQVFVKQYFWNYLLLSELERFVGSLRIPGLCEVLPPDAGDRGEREDGEPCVSCPGIWELQQLDPPTSTLSQGTRGEILSQVWYQSKNLSTVCAKYKINGRPHISVSRPTSAS